ncbi:hypothetical protein THAOC_10544, partial [Thalassiosira oceanica]
MGIVRVDRHEGEGLQTWKGSKAARRCWIWSHPGCENGEISGEHWGTAMVVEVEVGAHGVSSLPM